MTDLPDERILDPMPTDLRHATHAIVVTIGRNVGEVPMSPELWASYQDELRTVVRRYSDSRLGAITVDGNLGVGYWNDETDGHKIIEDNCVFVAVVPRAQDEAGFIASTRHGIALEHDVAHLGHKYGQEVTAVASGLCVLIESHKDEPNPLFDELVDDGQAALEAWLDDQASGLDGDA